MRISPRRHTLAVMRTHLGLTQKEMATLLECSKPTIQAIELGKLTLSEKLAELTSIKTGINLAWLLNGDITVPPVDVTSKPYTKEVFEQYRANSGFQNDVFGGVISNAICHIVNVGRLEALILRAYTDDKMPLCSYKLAQAFDRLESEFGVTQDDHKAVNSFMRLNESEFHNFDLNRVLRDAMKDPDFNKKIKARESTPFDRAIGKQEKLKEKLSQKEGLAYTISSDGQVRPILNATLNKPVNKKTNSERKPKFLSKS